jgi:ATP-binding cassette subfamily B protein
MDEQDAQGPDLGGVYKRVGRHLLRYWRGVAAMASLLSVGALLQVLTPWPLKYLIDGVLVGDQLHLGPLGTFDTGTTHARTVAAWYLAAAYLAITLLTVAFTSLGNYMIARVALRMIHDLRGELVAHMRHLSLRFHDNRSVGDSIFRAINDARGIQDVVIYGVAAFGVPLLHVIVTLVLMALLSPTLAVLVVAVAPPLLWTIRRLSRRIKSSAAQSRVHLSALTSLIQRTLLAIRAVQVFGKEAAELDRFRETSLSFVGAQTRFRRWEQTLNFATAGIIAVGTALIFGVAATEVINGVLTVGVLYVFISYLRDVYAAMQQVMQVWAPFQDAVVGVARTFQVLDEIPDISEPADAVVKDQLVESIAFRSVSLAYDPGHPVLEDIDICVVKGEKVALVGETGSGKSSLLTLIPRLYDVTDGALEIDGVDVRRFSIAALRSMISLVPQDPLLFGATVGQNILYGRLDASQEEIERAATLARAAGFIEQLPRGYETEIGERGVRLSAGQQQRISIARAFLKDAPILLLDEPTSALDLRTESDLLEGLDDLMEGRTVFIVAHRLSTVRNVDRIYVVDAGRIVETGSPAELLAADGSYAALAASVPNGAKAPAPGSAKT